MAAAIVRRMRNELRQFVVNDLEKTDVKLGTGAYGEVVQMKMKGQIVAVKKIHTMLLEAQNSEALLKNFEDECRRYVTKYLIRELKVK